MIDHSLSTVLDTAAANDSRVSCSVGFIQSSFMCVDVLARNLGVSFDWSDELSQTLSDVVRWSSQLMQLYSKRSSADGEVEKEQLVAECMKLLGSCFLCGGTICGVLGPRSLNNLAVATILKLKKDNSIHWFKNLHCRCRLLWKICSPSWRCSCWNCPS